VADPTTPVEVANWTHDDANSPAEYDHRAFTYPPEQRIAVVPIQSWNDSEINGAVLVRIDDSSITEIGRVTHVKPEEAPTSDCTELTGDDFPSEQSELHYMTTEDYGHVQICDPGQDGGYGSYYCDPIPLARLSDWGVPTAEVEALEARFDPESTIEICWPDDGNWRRQIQRSLVIGDNLWTMSYDSLQANALGGLAQVASVDLG
jgi:hypothetical protein